MIGRIIWIAALGVIAVLVTILQIDKQSEFSRGLAVVVPQPLRNYAQVHITKDALAKPDAARALEEAKRLVARRPIPAEYLTLLAAGQAKAGQTEQAGMTIQIAGQRGWRDPVAQEAVLRLALSAGDKAEAARRYAALFLRTSTPDALLKELGPAVLDEPGGIGQQTFVAIVVGGERWHAAFLRRGAQVMPPAAFAAITAASLKRGAKFDCRQMDLAIGLLRPRDAAAATALSAAAREEGCPQAAPAAGPAL